MKTDVFEQWESKIRGYCRAYPTVFQTAQNARQTDENGKSYLDFFAGAGVLNFGHNNENMKKALIAFIESDGVAHSLDMYTTAKRDFIEAFVATILKPRNMNHRLQFMGPTGTNAVEAALKLARRATGRPTVFAFSHGFHGMTLGALACTANDYFRQASGVSLDHVHRLPFENDIAHTGSNEFSDLQLLRRQLDDPSSGLKPPAAFILEAIQAEGGVYVASPEWLQEVRQIAKDYGSLFIMDDIQAACGRTGSYFSFDGMDLDPDIVCLAKGLGGFGTPLAMNLVKPEFDEQWSPGEHTGTFRGQGLSFVAGREGLRYFEDDRFLEDVRRKGEQMAERIETISAQHKNDNLEVRGKGMMQALDMQVGARAKAIATECFEQGLLIGPCGTEGRVLKLIPPLTIPTEELEAGLEILEKAIAKVMSSS